jgi:tetratricopeptide (TPR) repeat protein
MERREVLRKCLGGASVALVSPRLLPAVNQNQTMDGPEGFQAIVDDARSSYYWGEFKRAYDLFQRALLLVPPNLRVADLADIHEQRLNSWELVKSAEEVLPAHQASVQAEPEDPEKHFWLGFTLTRLDRHEEALKEYRAALKSGYQGECWNGIGWCYYRAGMPLESIKWFERTCGGEDTLPLRGLSQQRKAMENKVVAYAGLRMAHEARDTASEYIRRYGRLSWPETRALAKLGIDADGMYVRHCTRNA